MIARSSFPPERTLLEILAVVEKIAASPLTKYCNYG
jgi:hypothetical protein